MAKTLARHLMGSISEATWPATVQSITLHSNGKVEISDPYGRSKSYDGLTRAARSKLNHVKKLTPENLDGSLKIVCNHKNPHMLVTLLRDLLAARPVVAIEIEVANKSALPTKEQWQEIKEAFQANPELNLKAIQIKVKGQTISTKPLASATPDEGFGPLFAFGAKKSTGRDRQSNGIIFSSLGLLALAGIYVVLKGYEFNLYNVKAVGFLIIACGLTAFIGGITTLVKAKKFRTQNNKTRSALNDHSLGQRYALDIPVVKLQELKAAATRLKTENGRIAAVGVQDLESEADEAKEHRYYYYDNFNGMIAFQGHTVPEVLAEIEQINASRAQHMHEPITEIIYVARTPEAIDRRELILKMLEMEQRKGGSELTAAVAAEPAVGTEFIPKYAGNLDTSDGSPLQRADAAHADAKDAAKFRLASPIT